eukprot:3200777-Rhodomonas_salina.1
MMPCQCTPHPPPVRIGRAYSISLPEGRVLLWVDSREWGRHGGWSPPGLGSQVSFFKAFALKHCQLCRCRVQSHVTPIRLSEEMKDNRFHPVLSFIS